MRTKRLLITMTLALALTVVLACDLVGSTGMPDDCDDAAFREEIAKLSESNANASDFGLRVLKIYSGTTELSRSDNRLSCIGTALLNGGSEVSITYEYFIDRDGDAFIRYELQ